MSKENITTNDYNKGNSNLVEVDKTLPSPEHRKAITSWDEEEVHLRDYLDIVVRRKWVIICFLVFTFISTLIFTLSSTKLYKASASIEVVPRDQNITKFEEVITTDLRGREFYETMVEQLKSNALALRVIEKLQLAEHPTIIQTVFGNGNPDVAFKVKVFIASLLPKKKKNNIPLIGKETVTQRKLLKFISNNIGISPSRNSMMINVFFISPDRQLSQKIVNVLVEEFVHLRMENKLKASQLARNYLIKQIDRAKITLEKAEEKMNRFSKQTGIVSLDSKLNSVYRQLEELISTLAVAEIDLISKKAVYSQAIKDGPSNLPQVMQNEVIIKLKAENIRLQSEYENMAVIFHDDYPAVRTLRARIISIEKQNSREEEKIFLSIENEYQTTLKKVKSIRTRVSQQKQLTIDLNERATQYKIIAREVETNKGIYKSLLQRAKEIESMVGVSSSNIKITDSALLPISPFKPNVKMNLFLAIMVGLMGGIGMAFFIEYFTDTITNPDEIADRFQIPILGVVPLEKTNGYPLEMTFVSNPHAFMSEALRTTRISIQLSRADAHTKSILFTSTMPKEGKTTLAANLAQAFAGVGEKVIILDADMRRPHLHNVFTTEKNKKDHGLSKLLAGVIDKFTPYDTGIANLHFIPAGPIPPNPVELLASKRFSGLIKYLGRHYNRIILDGPPYQGFADALVISQHVGGVVLVSSMGETSRSAMRDLKNSLLNIQGTILGCIINKVNLNKRYGYQPYYKYYNYHRLSR